MKEVSGKIVMTSQSLLLYVWLVISWLVSHVIRLTHHYLRHLSYVITWLSCTYSLYKAHIKSPETLDLQAYRLFLSWHIVVYITHCMIVFISPKCVPSTIFLGIEETGTRQADLVVMRHSVPILFTRGWWILVLLCLSKTSKYYPSEGMYPWIFVYTVGSMNSLIGWLLLVVGRTF